MLFSVISSVIAEEWWSHMKSFAAGAVTVLMVWFWQSWQSQMPDQLDVDSISWVDPWSIRTTFKMTVEDWTNKIALGGGMSETSSKRRSHWPWETIRRSVLGKEIAYSGSGDEYADFLSVDPDLDYDDDDDDNDDNEGDDACSNKNERRKNKKLEKKKEICIGSIFGLDVGGTLSKLVYFEEKAPEFDPISPREKHYTVAACAQTVMKARMGNAGASTNHDSASTTTSNATTPSGKHRRRRSFSIGVMGRLKELQKERQQQMHSEESRAELRHLQELRQESLPDDLDHFEKTVHIMTPESSPIKEPKVTPPISTSSIKKSKSMFNLSSQSQQKAEALDRFYDFARRLDTYEASAKDHKLSFYSRELGGEFHFIRFETRWMKNAMELIRYSNLHMNIAEMGATGGGAHKYAEEWERMLGITMDKQSEMESLVAGMQFVLGTVVGECYTFRPHKSRSDAEACSTTASSVASDPNNNNPQVGAPLVDTSDSEESFSQNSKNEATPNQQRVDEWWWSRKVQRDAVSYSSSYPYLLVTIGTGVSILRVDGPRKHERISGSTIGGGTYWGLIRLLTDVENFEDVMQLAEKGDPTKVDMMVGDIYGDNPEALEKLGLPSDIVASSFGKLVAKQDPAEGLTQEDLARALLLMVTINIGQVAYLNAQLHNTPRIYFVGNFLRGNVISQRRLSFAINYWSKGVMEALFLEHEGYFGALGAFLISQNISHGEGGFFQWNGAPRSPQQESMAPGHDKPDRPLLNRRLQTFGA